MKKDSLSFYHDILRGKLVTTDDLALFKDELLESIAQIIISSKEPGEVRWLKTAEVRKLLRISNNTLTSLRVKGCLPFSRVGNIIYYQKADIENMLQERKKK